MSSVVLTDEIRRAVFEENGRKAGKAGGKARAKALSARRRSMIARQGALAMWAKRRKKK